MRHRVSRLVERLAVHYVDLFIVVSKPIADWYKQYYGLSAVYTIMNVPRRPTSEPRSSTVFRDRFGIGADEIVFISHGLLGEGRGTEVLLDVFAELGPPYHMVFMGYGPLVERIREWASRNANIHYHPAVRPEEVLTYASGADVGMALIHTSMSGSYTMPNKFFEYLFSGLPVIVGGNVEMARITREFDCGWVVKISQRDVARVVGDISWAAIEGKRSGVAGCARHFSWETEQRKLAKLYQDMFARHPRG